METQFMDLPLYFWGGVMGAVGALAWLGRSVFGAQTGEEASAFVVVHRELHLEEGRIRGSLISGRLGGVEVEVRGHNARSNTSRALLDGAQGARRTRIVAARAALLEVVPQ